MTFPPLYVLFRRQRRLDYRRVRSGSPSLDGWRVQSALP